MLVLWQSNTKDMSAFHYAHRQKSGNMNEVCASSCKSFFKSELLKSRTTTFQCPSKHISF